MVAFILLVIGGLNWLLVGLMDLDVVAKVFGMGTTLSKVVYVLVGLSAVYEVVTHKARCTDCSTKM
jgi:uncharacterized membrane protein YuzA (DUF378 family)